MQIITSQARQTLVSEFLLHGLDLCATTVSMLNNSENTIKQVAFSICTSILWLWFNGSWLHHQPTPPAAVQQHPQTQSLPPLQHTPFMAPQHQLMQIPSWVELHQQHSTNQTCQRQLTPYNCGRVNNQGCASSRSIPQIPANPCGSSSWGDPTCPHTRRTRCPICSRTCLWSHSSPPTTKTKGK